MSLINELIKSAKLAKQGKKVVVNPKPFFSAVDKAALDLQRAKGTGKEFMTELKKTKGVKPTEIEQRKLAQIEEMPKMTKDQFIDELEKRPPVKVSESVLPEGTTSVKDEYAQDFYDKDYYDLSISQREYIDNMLAKYGMDAQGQDYHLPGGENYREILLQLPHFSQSKVDELMEAEARLRRNPSNLLLARTVDALKAEKQSYGEPYVHPHWGAENPNVLAHMRVQDRKGPNGEKILHVEEIQSDWHQTGRDKGYIDPNKKPYTIEADQNGVFRVKDVNGQTFEPYLDGERISGFMTAEAAENAMKGNMGRMPKPTEVPDAPFKKNWHELAMKRLINYASENGYDGIAITPGKIQIDRYEDALRKNLDNLEYESYQNPDTGKTVYELSGSKNGKQVFSKEDLTPEEVKDLVGKDLFSKIEAGQGVSLAEERPLRPDWKRLEGDDISIGGEGMRGFYDKILPDYLNNFGKKYGVQAELQSIPTVIEEPKSTFPIVNGERTNVIIPAKHAQLHHFPITKEMREEVKQGMPLYQQIGVPIGAGAAGAELSAPQEEEPSYAAGGAVYDTTPDMNDGGRIIQGESFKHGGKVHVAQNSDTMFMELQDKKFKRK